MAATRFRLSLGLACALAMCAAGLARAQTIPAFSGADGAAANVSGGRGGIVYHVTKLNSAIDDPQRNDIGTIRYGLNNANFPAGVPRTIVFDVGGVFQLGRLPQPGNGWDPNGNGWDAQSRLTIGGTNVTIAGQTAPGAGVIFMGGGLKPQGNNNIIRNITVAAGYGLQGWWSPGNPIRAQPGTPEAGTDATQWFPDNTVYDAMDIAGTNLMIDHVSTLFATDETISMNEVAKNITVQYSNISQGQNYPQADAEGGGSLTGHALGSLLEAGNSTSAAISFHHNLYAHQKGRMPQMQGGQTGGGYYDFRNNVFYNWFGTAGSRSGTTFVNLVNNFYLAGDGGDNPIGGSNPGITTSAGGTGVLSAGSNVYRVGNTLDSNKDADPNDGVAVSSTGSPLNPIFAGGVNTYNGVTETANAQMFNRVLNYVGANWWNRDSVIDTPDERIVQEARTGTGKVIAWADNPWNNDPAEGAEWRALKNTPQANRAANWDTEPSIGYGIGDGMPSVWELAHGLDPNARDDAGDFDGDGYTNLEEYLNDIAAWPAPAPIVFSGATNNRYAQITNWDVNPDPTRTHNWQPSRFDVAELRSGAVVVDAVGQHAGLLRVAPAEGDDATLNVTDGWLHVGGPLEVGLGGAGTVNHSGGLVSAEPLTLGGGPVGAGFYNLSGTGVLWVGVLDKDPNEGGFSFTGGMLNAETVTFDLVNDGGVIFPATGLGLTQILGDLTMHAGSIWLDISGPEAGLADEIKITGVLTAGGTLAVSLLDGYMPAAGATFDLLDFESAGGEFTLDLPPLAGGLAWDSSMLLTTGELSVIVAPNADFNGDNFVDGADFLIWQAGLGLAEQTDRTRGDADGDGIVDGDDLAVWRSQFGTSPATAAGTAVPEPATGVLAGCSLVAFACMRRRGRQNLLRQRRPGRRGRQSRPSATAIVAAMALLAASPAFAQIKAFPQAEGFGAGALGGRGGDVYHVTNVTDSGVGSLRYGLENAPASGRTIVFDVGGWIVLNDKLGLTRSRVTIAGQTAPGGIGIRNDQFSVGGDDVVVRHMRFRPGKITNTNTDSVNTNENAQRVIYDHISAEFSTDGGFDLQADLVTLQYSSVSYGLISHSTGGLIQSPTGGAAGELSFHHNMFAHNETRNPKARAELIDWRDNVIFNYHNGFLAGESETDVNPNWRANFDGNTYISNIGGNAGSGGRPMMTGGRTQNYDLWYGVNALDRDSDSVHDPIVYTKAQAMANQSVVSSAYNWFDTPFAAAEVWQNASPAAAYTRVLQEFGATPWARDAVNQLIASQVTSRTGQRISNENSLGIVNAGYPNLNPGNLVAPLDSDGDGMPNAWEEKHGLDPLIASNNGDFDSDGFTNLEEYLNDLAAFKAIGPLEFDGTGRYADWANWTRRWEPSRLDDVNIATGTATVDAVGQRAGTLRIGSVAGQTGTLVVDSGWIELSSSLHVGAGGTGVVNHTNGEVRLLTGEVVIADGSYNISGGSLTAPRLSIATAGALNLTGGRVNVGLFSGDLVNQGATLDRHGYTTVTGDLTIESGSVVLDVGGDDARDYEAIRIQGALVAGGILDVNLIGGFTPAFGDRFDLFDFASATGWFTLDLPPLAGGLAWDSADLLSTGELVVVNADFDGNNLVDADDLVRWSSGYGLTGQTDNSMGDANGDGSVDGRDFLVWQRHLGPVGGLATAVPEPAAGSLALALVPSLSMRMRKRTARAQ